MRVIIIGTGLAGQLVLQSLRKLGFSGEILLFTQHLGNYYAKPSLSSVWTQKKCPNDLIMHTAAEVESKFNCKIYQEEVEQIHREKKEIQTKSSIYSYDKLVLAVGSVGINLDVLPNSEKIFRINHLEDYQQFYPMVHKEAEIAIVGGGLIGVEFAYDLAKHCHVTLFARSGLLWNMVPKEIGEYIKQSLLKRGVVVQTNMNIHSVVEKDKVIINGKTCADVMIAAVGLQSNINLANKASLKIDKAIEVNQFGQSSDPDIYALGDCAKTMGRILRYVPPIRICAKSISNHILGSEIPIIYPLMPVNLKTPDMPVCFCYNRLPKHWDVIEDEDGVVATAYDEDKLVAFALCGKHVNRRQDLLLKMS